MYMPIHTDKKYVQKKLNVFLGGGILGWVIFLLLFKLFFVLKISTKHILSIIKKRATFLKDIFTSTTLQLLFHPVA